MKAIYCEKYFCPSATILTSTRKQKDVVEAALAEGVLRPEDVVAPAPASRADLVAVHSERYVDAVLSGEPRDLAQSQGFAWSPEFRDLVQHTAGGQALACDLALRDGVAAHISSGAHHARRERGGGYCTFNYLVTAPQRLFASGRVRRVMVVDLDTHQGDGTYALTVGDERFYSFDISGVPFGVPEHDGVDGIYSIARDADAYFRALRGLPEAIRRFRPDLVEYQAGADCFEEDDMGAVAGLDRERLMERDRYVFQACRDARVPVAWNLAGGYIEGVTFGLHVNTIRVARAVFGG